MGYTSHHLHTIYLSNSLQMQHAHRAVNRIYNEQIDMHFPTPQGHVLAEMKSCHHGNLHSQVRRGISQLLEYQFIYRKSLGNHVIPVLIIETQPISNHRWLIEYTESIGILLAWKDGSRLVTTSNIPTALDGVVLPQ